MAPILLAVVLVGLVGPKTTRAAAHGPALKGQEVDRSAVLSGQTGACECLQQWYTLGFKPGPAAISGHLTACGDRVQPYCFMVVTLLRGNRTVGTASAQCRSSASHCNRTWSIRVRIRKQAVYYVQVKGEVGLTMNYTLRPSGHLYALRCEKYC
jgi:hypothetical protein